MRKAVNYCAKTRESRKLTGSAFKKRALKREIRGYSIDLGFDGVGFATN